MRKIIVIGGGLGGLSCAIRLAANGCDVTILEKENTVGGKLKRVVHDDYTFDMGPSTITMMDAFQEVFDAAGKRMEDYVEFYPLSVMTRNIFPDGHIVDLFPDKNKMEEQISLYSKEDARNYRSFLKESQKLFTISQDQFLNRLFLKPGDKWNYQLMKGFLQIKPMTTVYQTLKRFFNHPNTLAMFGRYATYVGSSPFRAPSIFNMMAHLESERGIFGIKGGTYSLVEAFEKLAKELGVTIKKNVKVEKIRVAHKNVVGVEADGELYKADDIVANADALSVFRQLIDKENRPSMSNRKLEKIEPSVSGFMMMLGVNKQFPILRHHNVFYPENYETEFTDIFEKRKFPDDPAIYICFSGYSDTQLVGENKSNLFVLVNAPAVTEGINWEEVRERSFLKITSTLEKRGMKELISSIEFRQISTPVDLEYRTGANMGAIYGLSSNSFRQAFFKVQNKAKDIEGLWFVGGSAHPGGGTPIVTKSGQLVAKAILEA